MHRVVLSAWPFRAAFAYACTLSNVLCPPGCLMSGHFYGQAEPLRSSSPRIGLDALMPTAEHVMTITDN